MSANATYPYLDEGRKVLPAANTYKATVVIVPEDIDVLYFAAPAKGNILEELAREHIEVVSTNPPGVYITMQSGQRVGLINVVVPRNEHLTLSQGAPRHGWKLVIVGQWRAIHKDHLLVLLPEGFKTPREFGGRDE